MNPLQKRTNPFDTRVTAKEEQTPKQTVQEPVEEYVEEEYIEEEPVIRPVQRPKTQRKPQIVEQYDNNREKYTSTMDRNIRRSIKILCAQRGILFASFVEDACREKLRKEGAL